ncbi:MAG: threonylcarbamoyl-AMP synthase [Chthoniobacterales bacterium]|nr:threonylcarbamoyl-AMP synthase [Chthoniobacterales bacterium]
MKTKIVSGNSGIATAVALLKQDQVVALPTETVYGLAGNAFSPQAVASIFEAKGRPLSDPLIVHLLDISWLHRVVILSPELEKKVMSLASAFWPGPLTLLLPKKETVPDLVTAGLETVAVRVPSNPVMRGVLASLDLPLAAPSANRFGRISPTRASDVFAELGGRIPLILDDGPCHHGLESTIVWPYEDLEKNLVLQILRPGPITAEMLAPFGKVLSQSVSGKAPGSLKSHYAPRKKLSWYDPAQPPNKDIGLLAFSQPLNGYGTIEILSASGDLREAATNLYGALRRLDESSVASLIAEPVPERGIGCAIMDRLQRAMAT